jgi:serine protease Do
MRHQPADRRGAPPLRAVAVFALATGLWCGVQRPVALASPLRQTPIVRAVEKARPSVVNIQGRRTVRSEPTEAATGEMFRQVNGMGTGILIDERGYILTNFHVVENVETIQVTLADKRVLIARLISHDPVTDLAVIKIDAGSALAVIEAGTSQDLMTGESVIAIGNAFGYEHTVTRGIISALHREVQVSATQQYRNLIQTDASINPGNSGGPLLNIDGEMIGINVAVRVGAQGIGFAIPVDEALDVAARLLSVEKLQRLSHGVVGEAKSRDTERTFVVTKVRQRSAAEKCGLQAGDVVLSVDGAAVARALDFERALLGHPAGQPVPLTVQRQGQTLTLELVLGGPAKESFEDRTWNELGLKLTAIPQEEFQRQSTKYRGGMRVRDVRSDGPAASQGIRVGDVLVGMHIWETVSQENLLYILNHADFERFQPIKFYILRGTETLYGNLRVERSHVVQVSRRASSAP